MAEALVSTLLDQFASILKPQIHQEVSLVVGVDQEVEKLCSNLSSIQAVLIDAEEKQVKQAAVRDWLDKLKDVSYDIDDVLDEWNTAIQKLQMEGNQHGPASQRQVRSFFHFPCFCCGRLISRRDIAHKIKALNGRLDAIAREKDRYNFVPVPTAGQVGGPMVPSVMAARPMTTSFIDTTEVKGREQVKKIIINMLLSETSETPSLRIFSLVGMGGIGKTTLAKLVYNGREVESHFNERIWVCVSDPFDEIRVAKAILEALKVSASNLVELQTILQLVQQSIEGKKFLLVLDDVWNINFEKWQQLKLSLKCGFSKGTILITTRKENVARNMGCASNDTFRIGQLSSEECRSIFSEVALFEKSSGERGHLEVIGRQIVDRCKGLPLAVKALGGLLRYKKSGQEWQSILDSELWDIEKLWEEKEAERECLAPLLLSYYDLPSPLRQCFLYCAIFPKDYVMETDELIKLWMAQGYLSVTSNKDMGIVGAEYFQNLAARSLFQDLEKHDDGGDIIKCKMHDIVHDFAQLLTKNECSIVKIDDTEEPNMNSFSQDGRHLMMVLLRGASFPDLFHNPIRLRSLIVETDYRGNDSIKAALPNLFNQLTCLRSLSLNGCGIVEIPSSINKLIHLRSLILSFNEKLKELPETLCELYNLQTLDIRGCEDIVKLPLGMGKLVNLKYLHNEDTHALLPKGIGRLSSLSRLDLYRVGHGEEAASAASLGDLKNLNNLQGGFEIRCLGNVADVEEAKQAQLKRKKGITWLQLDFWGEDEEGGWRKHHDEELLEALEPSPCLEVLMISHYKGSTLFCNWVMTSVTQLRNVFLDTCRNLEQLSPLGKLPSLESLNICEVKGVKKMGVEFLGIKLETQTNNKSDIHHHQLSSGSSPSSSSSSVGVVAFPKLTTLGFERMENWEEWDDDDDGTRTRKRKITIGDKNVDDGATQKITLMPCLRSLEIGKCPKLKALPRQLLQNTRLQDLLILDCPILQGCYEKETGPDWPKISHIPNIYIDCEWVQGGPSLWAQGQI